MLVAATRVAIGLHSPSPAGTRYTTYLRYVCSRLSIEGGQPRIGLHVLSPHVPGVLSVIVSSRNYRQVGLLRSNQAWVSTVEDVLACDGVHCNGSLNQPTRFPMVRNADCEHAASSHPLPILSAVLRHLTLK
jgi:hypothetical protein